MKQQFWVEGWVEVLSLKTLPQTPPTLAHMHKGAQMAGPVEVPWEVDQGHWGQGVTLPRGSSIRAQTTLFNGDLMMMSSRPLPAFTSPLGGCGETGFHGQLALSLTLEPRGQHFYGDEATQFL